jgi:hypothetical protein
MLRTTVANRGVTSCRNDGIPLLPCPVDGRCNGGQLVSCANHMMLIDGHRCSPRSEANDAVAVYVDQLSKLTVDHTCYYSYHAAGVSEDNMPLFLVEHVALNEDTNNALRLMETNNAMHQPPTFVIVVDNSLQMLVGLTATVPVAFPTSCLEKTVFVYFVQMFLFWSGAVLGFVAECVRSVLMFGVEVWWGCWKELPNTTISTTLVMFLFITLWTKASSKRRANQLLHRANQLLHADVEKAEADVLRTIRDAPTSGHESNLLLEKLTARVRGATQRKRFVESVWPHVTLRIEDNPNVFVRDRLKSTYKGFECVVVWKWSEPK